MANIKTVFTADTQPFKKGLTTIKEETAGIKSMLAGLAAGITVAGVVAFAKEVAELGEQLKEISDTTGIAHNELQKIITMGEIGGSLKMESFSKSIVKMSDYLKDARDPTSKAAESLGELGLNAEEMKRLKPEEQFDKINTAIAGLNSSQERLLKLTEIYGKTGKDMAPMFANGVAGYEALKVKADSYIKLTSKSAAAADDFNDELSMFAKSVKIAGGEVAGPAFIQFAKMLETLSMRIAKLQKDGTLASWGTKLGRQMEAARNLMERLFTEKNIKSFVAALGEVGTAIKTIWGSLGNSPWEKLINIVAVRKSSSLLSGVIDKGVQDGIKMATKSMETGAGGIFASIASRANIWLAIASGVYMAARSIKALEQSWNELNATMGETRLDAVMGEYDRLGSKIDENKRKLEESRNAERQATDNANALAEKKTADLEKQAMLLEKLRGLRDDETKKAEDAEEAVANGKEREAELLAELADEQRNQDKEAALAEQEKQDAIETRYSAEFASLEKLSAAELKRAAQGKGGQTQAEYMHKARLAVAARNLSLGINDPAYAAETRELAQHELRRREKQARAKSASVKDPVASSEERQDRIRKELEENSRKINENQAKADTAKANSAKYGTQEQEMEQQLRSAGNALYQFAQSLGNEEAVNRLKALAINLDSENIKLSKETQAFGEALADIPDAIANARNDMDWARSERSAQEYRTEHENKKLTEQQGQVVSSAADRAITDYEQTTGTYLGNAEKQAIRTNPEAYQALEARLAATRRGYELTKEGKSYAIADQKWQTDDAAFRAKVRRMGPGSDAMAGLVGNDKTNKLLESINGKLDNAVLVRTDGGR